MVRKVKLPSGEFVTISEWREFYAHDDCDIAAPDGGGMRLFVTRGTAQGQVRGAETDFLSYHRMLPDREIVLNRLVLRCDDEAPRILANLELEIQVGNSRVALAALVFDRPLRRELVNPKTGERGVQECSQSLAVPILVRVTDALVVTLRRESPLKEPSKGKIYVVLGGVEKIPSGPTDAQQERLEQAQQEGLE